MADHEHDDEITTNPGDTLLFENDRVRVWSMTLPANGGMYDFHRHLHDHVIIWPDAGRAEAQTLGEEGWGITVEAEPGLVMFKTVGSTEPLVPHRLRNVDDHEHRQFIVELIQHPSPSTEALPLETNGRGTTTYE